MSDQPSGQWGDVGARGSASTVGSLCSGYGGLDMALLRALGGGRLLWHVDFAEGPQRILKHRYPDVPLYGDLKALNLTNLPRPTWLTAGYPCQPFSSAGLQLGEADERHLWPYVARAVCVLRPRHVLLENVANHLRLGFQRVLADLAALGYDARWGLVRASDAGAPHARARLFVVADDADPTGERRRRSAWEQRRLGSAGLLPLTPAYAEGDRREGHERGRPEPERSGPASDRAASAHPDDGSSVGERSRPKPWSGGGAAVADTDGAPGRPEQPGSVGPSPSQGVEPEAGRRAGRSRRASAPADAQGDGRYEGRAEPAGLVGGPDVSERGDAAPDTDGDGLSRLAGSQAGRDSLLRSEWDDPDRCGVQVDWREFEPAIRRWERVLGRPAPVPAVPDGRGGKRRLNPRFVEWMQGLPAGHVTGVPDLSRNEQLRALGNGVVPQQALLGLAALGVVDRRLEEVA